MADLADLQRQAAFYGAGGQSEGTRDIDKVNKIFGTVQSGGDSIMGIVKNVLAAKKTSLENQQKQGELTPWRDIAAPLTPANATINANTAPDQRMQMDQLYGKRETMGTTTLDQMKTAAGIQHLSNPQSTVEDAMPATTVYMPSYIKKILPDVPDDQIQNVKVGQIKSAILTQNQAGINEDRDLSRKGIEQDRALREEDRNTRIRETTVSKFNANPAVRKNISSIESADNVLGLIAENSPLADRAIPTYMARASGEVGNLSEADKAPFGGTQAIMGRLNQVFEQASSGKLTPENREYVRQLAETMKRSATQNNSNHAKTFAAQYGKIGGFGTPEQIFAAVSPDISTTTASAPPPSDLQISIQNAQAAIAAGKDKNAVLNKLKLHTPKEQWGMIDQAIR